MIDQNSKNDDDADEDLFPVGIGADQHESVTDHLNQCGTDDGASGAAHAAGKVSSANHRCGNDPQLVPRREIGGRSAKPARDQNPAEACGNAAQSIDGDEDTERARP